MWKNYLALYGITIVAAILAAASRTIPNETLSLLCGFTLTAVYTYLALRKTKTIKPFYAFVVILVGICSIEFIPRLFSHENATYSLLSSFANVIGVCCGYALFGITGKTKKWIFAVIAIVFMVLYATLLPTPWKNNVYCGTFTGKIDTPIHEPVIFLTEKGDSVPIDQFKGKYLVLSCWYFGQGASYPYFDTLQKVYEEYKNNPEIAIYGAMVMTKGDNDPVAGTNFPETEGYTFPCLSIPTDSPLLNFLNPKVHSTTLFIFDKEGKLIYHLLPDNVEKVIHKLLI